MPSDIEKAGLRTVSGSGAGIRKIGLRTVYGGARLAGAGLRTLNGGAKTLKVGLRTVSTQIEEAGDAPPLGQKASPCLQRLILELSFAGKEILFGRVSSDIGGRKVYPGFDTSISLVDQVEGALASESLQVSLLFPFDVSKSVSAGAQLDRAKGTVYYWDGVGDYEKKKTPIFSGELQTPSYGASCEPVTATLVENSSLISGNLGPEGRLSVDTWGDFNVVENNLSPYPKYVGGPTSYCAPVTGFFFSPGNGRVLTKAIGDFPAPYEVTGSGFTEISDFRQYNYHFWVVVSEGWIEQDAVVLRDTTTNKSCAAPIVRTKDEEGRKVSLAPWIAIHPDLEEPAFSGPPSPDSRPIFIARYRDFKAERTKVVVDFSKEVWTVQFELNSDLDPIEVASLWNASHRNELTIKQNLLSSSRILWELGSERVDRLMTFTGSNDRMEITRWAQPVRPLQFPEPFALDTGWSASGDDFYSLVSGYPQPTYSQVTSGEEPLPLADFLGNLFEGATGNVVDVVQTVENAKKLGNFKFGGYFDTDVDLGEWINNQLLPLIPMAWRQGDNGLYLDVVDYRVDKNTAIFLQAGCGIVRETDVQYLSSEIVNSVVIDYKPDENGNYQATFKSPQSIRSQESQRRYGVKTQKIESEIIYDENTALAVSGWLIEKSAFALRSVGYSSRGGSFTKFKPGDQVVITDEEIGLFDAPGIVNSVDIDSTGASFLVYLLEELAGGA